jgi:hypothetical protein
VALVFDGNPDTVWDSKTDQEPGMWFKLDIGSLRRIERVVLEHPKNHLPRATV